MSEIELLAIKVQIDALVDAWTKEWQEMTKDIKRPYQKGYADALDRCTQALRILK